MGVVGFTAGLLMTRMCQASVHCPLGIWRLLTEWLTVDWPDCVHPGDHPPGIDGPYAIGTRRAWPRPAPRGLVTAVSRRAITIILLNIRSVWRAGGTGLIAVRVGRASCVSNSKRHQVSHQTGSALQRLRCSRRSVCRRADFKTSDDLPRLTSLPFHLATVNAPAKDSLVRGVSSIGYRSCWQHDQANQYRFEQTHHQLNRYRRSSQIWRGLPKYAVVFPSRPSGMSRPETLKVLSVRFLPCKPICQ